ncbi:MAG: F0F1 ATP synthase subunit gamma [Sandaracinaceae bacterium]
MANLKAIRKRIGTVKNTQKITKAMKMVAAARLSRAQAEITRLRPFALKTLEVLSSVAARAGEERVHPLLARRPPRRVLFVVITSDRGLAGAFNANVQKAAYQEWKALEEADAEVTFAAIGRKGRGFLRRRGATIRHEFSGVFEALDFEKAAEIGRTLTAEYTRGGLERIEAEERGGRVIAPSPRVDYDATAEVPYAVAHVDDSAGSFVPVETFEKEEPELDAVFLVYNQFRSAISQTVVVEQLLPIVPLEVEDGSDMVDFIYEPSKRALLDRLLPLYVQAEVYRALLESVASEHGARMTAMDAATSNASDIIDNLTLQYNRARQAAITKELMEIIGGAEALKG